MTTTVLFEREAIPQMEALQSFALQLCKDEQRSNDLVQETMLKAFRYFHTYKMGTNCRAWLFQICKNSYINEYRRRQYEPVVVDFREESASYHDAMDGDTEHEFHVRPSDESALLTHEAVLSDEVASALNSLPTDYQTALILCDIEGCTYEEIADFVQSPIGTIRSRIHRGRKMLVNRLGAYAHNQGYVSHEN